MAQTRQSKKRRNWKIPFFLLLGLNVLILVTFLVLLFWPVPDNEFPDPAEITKGNQSEFVIRSSKSEVEELVNAYLVNLLKGTEHRYSITLGDDVQLNGELPVFSTTVPLKVNLTPHVQENGDLILEQTAISVGLLSLPNQKIMEYIGRYLPMPEWVQVNPKDEQIYIALSEMELDSNLKVAAESLDLETDNISFRLSVPYERLGIDEIVQ